jgi:D-alanyl-D-alanine carboxypeptidase/D-alanyl-D-alanine-endopeptidase (penicillin-binding protein 4)
LFRFGPALTAVLALAPAAPLQAQIDEQWIAGEMSSWYRTTSRRAPGHWGIAVADQTGRILWSVRPDEPLIPASTVKLFTTGFARSVLGGSARRSTRVMGQGRLDPETGEWVGSWALELNGDPSLERAEGSGPTLYDLALQLASGGVRKLSGPLEVRSSDGPAEAIYPAAWSSRHRGRLFAPLGAAHLRGGLADAPRRAGDSAGCGTAPDGSPLVTVMPPRAAGRLRLLQRTDGWV